MEDNGGFFFDGYINSSSLSHEKPAIFKAYPVFVSGI